MIIIIIYDICHGVPLRVSGKTSREVALRNTIMHPYSNRKTDREKETTDIYVYTERRCNGKRQTADIGGDK